MQINRDGVRLPPTYRLFVPASSPSVQDHLAVRASMHVGAQHPDTLSFVIPPKVCPPPHWGPPQFPSWLRRGLGMLLTTGRALMDACLAGVQMGYRWVVASKPTSGTVPFIDDGALVQSYGQIVLSPYNEVPAIKNNNRLIYARALKEDTGQWHTLGEMRLIANHYGTTLRVFDTERTEGRPLVYRRIDTDDLQQDFGRFVDWFINDHHRAIALIDAPACAHKKMARLGPHRPADVLKLAAESKRQLRYGDPVCCLYMAIAYAIDAYHCRAIIDALHQKRLHHLRHNTTILTACPKAMSNVHEMSDETLFAVLEQNVIDGMHQDWLAVCARQPDLLDGLVMAALADARPFCWPQAQYRQPAKN